MYRYDSNRQKQPELAERLREVREDLCGERGAELLADALIIGRDDLAAAAAAQRGPCREIDRRLDESDGTIA